MRHWGRWSWCRGLASGYFLQRCAIAQVEICDESKHESKEAGNLIVTQGIKIRLEFSKSASATVRRRIAYAFRTFCAVYGYEPVIDQTGETKVTIRYGLDPISSEDIVLPACYQGRAAETPASPPRHIKLRALPHHTHLSLDSAPCFWASPEAEQVDWLGEIFEWLSCAQEYAVAERDSVGRIPFSSTLFGRFGLDPTIPYAALAMFELNRMISAVTGDERRTSPFSDKSGTVIGSSHDLDYLPLSFFGDIRRLIKNIGIAFLLYHDVSLAGSISVAAVRGFVSGHSPLDCVDEMLHWQLANGVRSTYNLISRQAHERDANYRLDDQIVRETMRRIAHAGMEIGLHGSYTSLEDDGLRLEVERLEAAGYRPQGLRQHWLRFAGSQLFDEVARLGLLYDSTVGFSDHVGFRSGACFPYRPYDFGNEQAYPFFEIPLVIMDGALYEHERASGKPAMALCDRVLDMVEAFGGGGVAILWHNAVIRGGQLPTHIGNLYWSLRRPQHKWVACREVAGALQPAFERAFKEQTASCSDVRQRNTG